MKKTSKILCVVGVAAVVVAIPIVSVMYFKGIKADDKSLTYLIKPGDAVWSELSIVEQREACDFPFDEVNALNTDQVLQLALDYPLCLDFMAFNDWQEGLQMLSDTSSVYRVLLEREDLKESIDKIYDDATSQDTNSSEEAFKNKQVLDVLLQYLEQN